MELDGRVGGEGACGSHRAGACVVRASCVVRRDYNTVVNLLTIQFTYYSIYYYTINKCCLLVENIESKRKRVEKREGYPLEKAWLTHWGVLNNILPAAAGGDAAPYCAAHPRRARDGAHTPSMLNYCIISSTSLYNPPARSNCGNQAGKSPSTCSRLRHPHASAQMGGNIYNARLPAARRLPPAGCPPIVYFPTD